MKERLLARLSVAVSIDAFVKSCASLYLVYNFRDSKLKIKSITEQEKTTITNWIQASEEFRFEDLVLACKTVSTKGFPAPVDRRDPSIPISVQAAIIKPVEEEVGLHEYKPKKLLPGMVVHLAGLQHYCLVLKVTKTTVSVALISSNKDLGGMLFETNFKTPRISYIIPSVLVQHLSVLQRNDYKYHISPRSKQFQDIKTFIKTKCKL